MNIIDISNWQFGLNLQTLFNQNHSLDGVVVKCSGGVSYINPSCEGWATWLVENGKPFGLYHYLDDDGKGSSGAAEAAYFVKQAKPYIGKAILFADYEGNALKKGTGYLKEFLDAVLEMTGVRPAVYCSLSVVQSQDFTAIANAGYKLWVAQYADMQPVYGFVDNPWQKGSVSPFASYVMHQYTSCGHLNGWDGNLDFDKFTGSYAAWVELARGDEPAPHPSLKPADPVVVSEVVAGKYGNGTERVTALREAGYDPESVQNMVNECYATALSCRKYLQPYDEYINTIIKIVRLL